MKCKRCGPLGCLACGKKFNEWISVKDMMPEEEQVVLMMEEGHDGLPAMGWYECEDCIPGFYPNGRFDTIRMHVTHWMPIPSLD